MRDQMYSEEGDPKCRPKLKFRDIWRQIPDFASLNPGYAPSP